jgi:pimeloyl-ACP methyl ester carboxylesterase
LVKDVFLSGWDEEKQRKIYYRLQKQSAHVTYEVMKQRIFVDEKKVSCPLYFIARREDVTIPSDVVKKIAQKYHSNFDEVSGNHYIFEDWQEIAKLIRSFIGNL